MAHSLLPWELPMDALLCMGKPSPYSLMKFYCFQTAARSSLFQGTPPNLPWLNRVSFLPFPCVYHSSHHLLLYLTIHHCLCHLTISSMKTENISSGFLFVTFVPDSLAHRHLSVILGEMIAVFIE